MIYLIKNGISLRLEQVIDPTLETVGDREIAKAMISRLTPQFQPARYVLIGRDPSDPQSNILIENLVAEFERNFNKTPNVIRDLSEFETCESPCWIITDQHSAHQLAPNKFVEEKIAAQKVPFFSLTFMNFKRDIKVPGQCDVEKRVTEDCVTPLAVRAVRRKMKEEAHYFFVAGYSERDYFLLIEK